MQKLKRTAAATVIAALALLLLRSDESGAQGVVLPLSAEDQQIISAKLGAGVVGAALPGTPVNDVAELFPLQGRQATYQVTSGPHAGQTQTLGVAKLRRPAGKLAWRFQFSPTLAGFIHQSPDADLMIPAVIDSGEGVVVKTTPANPFVLKGMKPGETRSYSQQVPVVNLEDPADQEYSGSLHGSYTYVGAYNVTVPAGSFKAILFRLKCNGKVGPAETKDAAYYFFAPGKGVVAMISQEDATAFWIIHIDTSSGRVLSAD